MKKYLFLVAAIISSTVLISWGVTGHRSIGKIASFHLTPQAQNSVKDLLGNESLADVSTYADEIRSQAEYKYTAPWHYINLPKGLSFDEFKNMVEKMTVDNVYKALLKCKSDLMNPQTSRAQKIFALKFMVHLVGDLHQPMHVSREEDRGGNSIHVTFGGKEGNLHGLWDTDLLEHEGLTYEQIAKKADKASPADIYSWQHDGLITWLFESYQISSQLYDDAAKNSSFDNAYYLSHLPIITERLEKAGIRLAGLLNEVFAGYKPSVSVSEGTVSENNIPLHILSNQASGHIGELVKISGRLSDLHTIQSNNMIIGNVGNAYPTQDFSFIIKSENQHVVDMSVLQNMIGKTVSVTGRLIEYKGKPEIEVTSSTQISY